MKVFLVEFDIGESKKGDRYYRMSVQGKFLTFGKIKTKIVDVNLTRSQYKYFSQKDEGEELELDFVIPLPDFPLVLNENEHFED